MTERYDAAVIGTGPAGLSAAVTLKLRNKKVLLIGSSEVSDKVSKAHEIQNYLGLPSITGEDLAGSFLKHVKQMGLEIQNDRITAVYAMGDYYALQSRKNEMYEASTVILATGVSFGKLYPNEETFLGRGVSYCATCDAPLYRGKIAAIIGSSEQAEEEVLYMTEICEKIYYIPLYGEVKLEAEGRIPSNLEILRKKPRAIEGGFKADRLVLEDQTLDVDGIFILRESLAPGQLVPGLSVEENHVSVNRQMETSLPGCFACGDITGTPYQYIKAAGEGNVAALSAVHYLAEQK